MAVNDIQMATLPLTPQGEKPVIVTFYKVPATPNILHYTTSGIGSLSELRADIPLTTFPFYAWDQKSDANRIMWGAAANAATSILSLVDTGVIVPAPAPVPPTASAAISTLTSETTTPISSAVAAPAPSSIGVASTTSSGSQPSTTTSINQAPKTVQKDSSSISNGAVAGVAVGCLAAGIILAGLVLCLCGRKRKSFPARDYEASSTVLMPHEKGFTVEAVPLSSGSPNASPLSGTLPLPLEDKAIIGEISKISNSVKNHVQSYYQMGRISPGLIDLDDIHALGSGQPIPAGTLSTLLGNTATREIGLRFCVAWVVCSRMLPGKDSVASLLPVEFAKCYQTVAKEHGNPSDQSLAKLSRWRVATAELLQARYVRNPFTRSDSRNENIQAAVVTIENILRPFADSRMDNGDRKRNLEEILKRSALFAFTLFSQPSTWGFDWEEEGLVKSGDLTIFPCLLQLSDENGQPVVPPRPFSEAVVRRLTD